MEYPIRQLTIGDYDSITALWEKCGLPYRPRGRDSKDSIAREINRAESGFLGMFDRDRLIGFVLATSDGRKGWINRLAIDPDYQKHGLGSRLLEKAEKFLKDTGIMIFAALIEGDNRPSFTVFKKAGYIYHEDIAYYSKRISPEV